MKTAEEYRAERDDAIKALCEVGNLVSALEVVAWQLCQQSATGEIAQLRDAVVGISRSMAKVIEDRDG